MRIKVECVPPLPSAKAWFSVYCATTISELKSVLCADLPTLSDARVRGQDILLVLDDFELLDSSPIDVIRENDLVIIKRKPPSLNKRKAPIDNIGAPRKRARHADDARTTPQDVSHTSKGVKQPAPMTAASRKPSPSTITSSSESESDSESGSSGSDSSSPSSSSESESDTDSSSDTSSSENSSRSTPPFSEPVPLQRPGLQSVKPTSATKPAQDSHRARSTSIPHVPPGTGKPSTHSRNLRRRRKRMYERLTATAEPASVNAIPLGVCAQSNEQNTAAATESEAPQTAAVANDESQRTIMMASLQNKNKKKGFKKSMSSAFPQKIVFANSTDANADTPVHVDENLQEALPFTRSEDNDVFVANARLVPPSEKQERGLLPPNMFVTSIDVEEGLRPKRKQKKRQPEEQIPDYEHDAEADILLSYDDIADNTAAGGQISDVPIASGSVLSQITSFDREAINNNWLSLLPKISERSQVQPGTHVGWKELGINTRTFSPEVLLKMGRVISCEDQMVVEALQDEEKAEVSFGGLIVADESERSEVSYTWNDVLQGDWRILP